MIYNSKKNQELKIGRLRDNARKGHQSYFKYPEEKRRA